MRCLRFLTLVLWLCAVSGTISAERAHAHIEDMVHSGYCVTHTFFEPDIHVSIKMKDDGTLRTKTRDDYFFEKIKVRRSSHDDKIIVDLGIPVRKQSFLIPQYHTLKITLNPEKGYYSAEGEMDGMHDLFIVQSPGRNVSRHHPDTQKRFSIPAYYSPSLMTGRDTLSIAIVPEIICGNPSKIRKEMVEGKKPQEMINVRIDYTGIEHFRKISLMPHSGSYNRHLITRALQDYLDKTAGDEPLVLSSMKDMNNDGFPEIIVQFRDRNSMFCRLSGCMFTVLELKPDNTLSPLALGFAQGNIYMPRMHDKGPGEYADFRFFSGNVLKNMHWNGKAYKIKTMDEG